MGGVPSARSQLLLFFPFRPAARSRPGLLLGWCAQHTSSSLSVFSRALLLSSHGCRLPSEECRCLAHDHIL